MEANEILLYAEVERMMKTQDVILGDGQEDQLARVLPRFMIYRKSGGRCDAGGNA